MRTDEYGNAEQGFRANAALCRTKRLDQKTFAERVGLTNSISILSRGREKAEVIIEIIPTG